MCAESGFSVEKSEGTGMNMDKLNLNTDALSSLHRFGDVLEEAVCCVESDLVKLQPVRDAADCIGRHWYGMRCLATCKRSGARFYLHMGLIYFASTRYGLMVELDEKNNKSCYAAVKQNIAGHPLYEINCEEPEYFKLFMPETTFLELSGKKRGRQIMEIRDYVRAAAEGIAQAAYEEGFHITFQDMTDARNLAEAFDETLQKVQGRISRVEINYKDKDNFGQYAQGFRYYLGDQAGTIRMYAYFGAIYSYKKSPAGIFAEVDRFSNPDIFDRLCQGIKPSEGYLLSSREPGFIKLFMTLETTEAFNRAAYEGQIEILKSFLAECNDRLVEAGLYGNDVGKEQS